MSSANLKGVAKWREAHPERYKAHEAVSYAIRKGKLIPGPCAVNDEHCKGRLEAHHYMGYDKEHWLDVQWLCRKHHALADLKLHDYELADKAERIGRPDLAEKIRRFAGDRTR